ncbi:spermidine synthase [Pseudobythopirellula maris]|uniref:Spermidine synthase n=1 Tax=Pseudobythopirellula maris TaxID=2527991 RepID=A0A5C5ZJY7_9BACT|nr:spermidine synthase [Pseudobythopirellula maris]TWT86773.1 spermidine synthase [Pseudobythopirellula maris]
MSDRPPKFKVLAYEESPLGLLCLRRWSSLSQPGLVVTEVTLNHEFLMSSHNTASERALADVAVEMHSGGDDHNQGLSVLVGGLGLGYTARAALEHTCVASVEVVEYLPQVIGWLREGLVPLSEELNAEARLAVSQGDAFARLLGEEGPPDEAFDLVLIDIDHSPDDRLPLDAEADTPNRRFYTVEGLRQAKRRLAPHGVLGVWSYAESSPFVDALREVFDEVRVEPIRFENELIDSVETDWLFFARDRA